MNYDNYDNNISKPNTATATPLVVKNLRYIKARLELREKKATISYKDFASRIGMGKSAVEKWFSGQINPGRTSIAAVARYVNSIALFNRDITTDDIRLRDLAGNQTAGNDPVVSHMATPSVIFQGNFNFIVKKLALAEGRDHIPRAEIAERMNLKKTTIDKWYSIGAVPSVGMLRKICEYVNERGIFPMPLAPNDLLRMQLSSVRAMTGQVMETSPILPGLDDMQRLNRLARRLNPDARAALIAFLESVT